jgi:hypothetical protein
MIPIHVLVPVFRANEPSVVSAVSTKDSVSMRHTEV